MASGTLYLAATGRLAVHVHEPVLQVMSWTDTLTTIVYPEERRAFLVRHSGAALPDFLFPSSAYRYVAQSLDAMGYELQDYATIDDTTVYYWKHPKAAGVKALPAEVVTKLVDELPVSMSSFDGDGNQISGIDFSSYAEVGELTIPLHMERWRTDGASRSTEEVILTDPVWLDEVPPEMLSPDIGSDYEVRRYNFGDEE